MLRCGHTYCQDCLVTICTQFGKIECPECGGLLALPARTSPQSFVKSLTTNYLAYQQENSSQADAVTRSQYFKHAEAITKAKEAYVEPLVSAPIPEESDCRNRILDMVRYTFFTVPWFAGLITYVLFVIFRSQTI